MEVFVFPRVMTDYGMLLENDAIVVVRGRLDLRDETPKLVCMEVRRPELATNTAQELRIVAAARPADRGQGGPPPRRAAWSTPDGPRCSCTWGRRSSGCRPRVQRGQPQRPGRGAEDPARPERHRGRLSGAGARSPVRLGRGHIIP